MKICARCIMDTTDPFIVFDEQGYCNHCSRFFSEIKDVCWFPNQKGRYILDKIIKNVKIHGKRKLYDGVIGLSGGVDSSYLLCKLREWGIRPLAVHVDAGWNSELAVKNIEVLCKKLDVDLHTIVIDWDAMRSVQVAFLRSGVVNQDIPQDHAFFASLFSYAIKNKIRYVFSGSNFSTESILPAAWGYDAMDATYLCEIVRRFGDGNLKRFPVANFWKLYFYYPYLRRMKILKPLNFINYKKFEAINELESRYGWRYYGAKHWESRFTKFFQGYYLPKRFGYDKRKAHLSSLIVSGEITRNEAMEEMKNIIYSPDKVDADINFISKKLKISRVDLENFINSPMVPNDIPTNEKLVKIGKYVKKILKIGFVNEK